MLNSGKPGKLVRIDNDSWDFLPFPDQDPVNEKREQGAQPAKSQRRATPIRSGWEQTRRDEAHRDHYEERMPSLLKEREAEKLYQVEALRKEQLKQASKNLMDSSRLSMKPGPVVQTLSRNDGLSRSYRAAIEQSLRRFVANGDDIACTGVYIYQYGSCELCGHKPIKWHYILENLSSHDQIVVGSECIKNFKIILEEWGYRPAYIVFPECLKQFTRWILDEDSGAIRFSDAVACFYTRNPRELYGDMPADQKPQMFIFAKKLEGMLVARNAFSEADEVHS